MPVAILHPLASKSRLSVEAYRNLRSRRTPPGRYGRTQCTVCPLRASRITPGLTTPCLRLVGQLRQPSSDLCRVEARSRGFASQLNRCERPLASTFVVPCCPLLSIAVAGSASPRPRCGPTASYHSHQDLMSKPFSVAVP